MKIGKRFEGKVAIVTASTQGIGFGIAERLGLEGASVVVSSRKQVRGRTRSLSIFGCCFIFWCNYASSSGVSLSSQSWFVVLIYV
jgi:enoyl-[acyl-carrier-protein] reductase (NADH)